MKKLFLVAMTAMVFAACNDSADSTMTTKDTAGTTASADNDLCAKQERNKQTALASVNALINKNVEEALKSADSNVVDYADGSMPPAKGVDSIRHWMNEWTKAVPDYRAENLMAAADGDKVLVYGIWNGTWKNDFMGMKATGKTFKVADVDVFTFNDSGKIIEHRNVQSMATMASQLGMNMGASGQK
jgi:steroid delta-isomerase-like uncharacterized protein